jgi:diguanylate cyclase (GGDEF)-like protein/PAS domain S-box-containing protein
MAPPSKIEHHIADYIKKDPHLAKKISHYQVPGFFKRKEIEEALRESEQKFRSIFDNAMVGIILIDLQNNKFSDANNLFCQMLGYSHEEIGNLGIMDIYHEMARSHVIEKIEGLTRGKSTQAEDLPMIRKDGTVLYAVVDFSPVTLSGENYLIGLFRDVTVRKELERSSQEIEEKFRIICTMAKDAIIMMDNNGNVTYFNNMAEDIFGYAAEDIVGKELHVVLAPAKYLDAYRKGMEPFKATGYGNAVGKTIELVGLKKGGIEFPIELSLSAVRLKGKWNAIGIIRNITTRKDMEAKLKDLSNRDELTGLYNRRGFIELIEQQVKVAERMKFGMHLLFADLDHLKEINDNFGHQEGDRALIEIANLLTETFRTSDIVARIGGDEFVAIALKTQEEHAEILKSRLNKSISARNTKGDLPYTLSLSIGIAYCAPEQTTSIENLLAEGDRLMYEAKRNRKNNE